MNESEYRARLTAFAVGVAALAAGYADPLLSLVRFALRNDLYSHIVLVPAIAAYLAFSERRRATPDFRPAWPLGASLAAASLLAAGAPGLMVLGGSPPAGDSDTLSLLTLSFVFGVAALAAVCLGWPVFRRHLFALAFLLLLVPFPQAVEHGIDRFLQAGTSLCFDGMLRLTGTPFVRDANQFALPGLSLRIATECSGIRSSLVLFMTGLLAARLFLRTGWRRTVMAVAFLPIGLLRNAFRVLTLALLTIHVDPRALDSALHHRGGPVFFVISLAPLFAVLLVLRWSERRAGRAAAAGVPGV